MGSALSLTVIPEADGWSKIGKRACFVKKRGPWGTLEQGVLLGGAGEGILGASEGSEGVCAPRPCVWEQHWPRTGVERPSSTQRG